VDETLSYGVAATCDPNPALSVSVTSNQTDTDGLPDWVIISPHHVKLSEERNAPNARRYTVTITATDSAGASSRSSVQVKIPLSQGD
jgi:hypothetical protein